MTPDLAETPTTTSTPATSSAPSVPSTSTPATSATSTTVATPTAAERPNEAAKLGPTSSAKDIAAYLKAGEAAADATTPQTPLVTDSAAAATTPLTTDQTAGAIDPTNAKGPIPFDVHHTALENARVKAVTEYKDKYGWAEQFKPEQRAWMLDMAQRMNDPWAFHQWFGEQLSANPRTAAQRPQPAAAKPQPDVQVLDQQGNVVGMSFSAERQAELLTWERQQMTGEFKQLLQPFQQERDQRIQSERLAAQQKDLNTRADATFAHVNKILRMDSLSKEEQVALSGKLLKEMETTPNAIEAALTVFEREVVPTLTQKAEQTALETNRKKAAGNTATGGAAAPATIGPHSTQKEISAYLRSLEG